MNEKIRFEIKAKNNRLYKAIYSEHKSLADFCSLEQIPYAPVCALLNLTQSPYGIGIHKDGQMNYHAMRLCEIFQCDPLELFPPELYTKGQKSRWVIEKNINKLAMGEIRAQIEYIKDDKIQDSTAAKVIDSAMECLDPKQSKVINMRFGRDGYEAHTLEECAKDLNITGERVRQIEAKALRKLKHPAKRLSIYL